jgi:hypothetical protein
LDIAPSTLPDPEHHSLPPVVRCCWAWYIVLKRVSRPARRFNLRAKRMRRDDILPPVASGVVSLRGDRTEAARRSTPG